MFFRFRRVFCICPVIAFGLLACGAEIANGQFTQFAWNGTTTGNWSDGANWVGGNPPPTGPTTLLSFGNGTGVFTATNDLGSFELGGMRFNHIQTAVPTTRLVIAGDPLLFNRDGGSLIQQDAPPPGGLGTGIPRGGVRIDANVTIVGTGLSIQSGPGSGGQGPIEFAGTIGGTALFQNSSRAPVTLAGGTAPGGLGQIRNDVGAVQISGNGSGNTYDIDFIRIGIENPSGQNTASLLVAGGAIVNVSDQLQVGIGAATQGSVRVNGAGTIFNQAATAFIGNDGNGSFEAQFSGTANFASTVNVGVNSGSAGTFTALDGTANVSTNFNLGVNSGATGTLDVINGNVVSSTAAGSNLSVGIAGTGFLNVNNGGTLTVGSSANVFPDDNELVLGRAAGGVGTVTVRHNGSSVIASNLVVGESGTGTLHVSQQALVDVNGITAIGFNAGGVGTVSVADANTLLRSGEMQVGLASTANSSLAVSAGGAVQTTTTTFVAAIAGSNASVSITDSGSSLTTQSLQIGGAGNMHGGVGNVQAVGGGFIHASAGITIYDQGTLSVDATSQIDVGSMGGIVGSVNVNDGGQLLGTGNIEGDLRVGSLGILAAGVTTGDVGSLNIDGDVFLASASPLLRSNYLWDISTAGTATSLLGGSSATAMHDQLLVDSGSVTFQNANLQINELSGFDSSFDPNASYSWRIFEINGPGSINLLGSNLISFAGASSLQDAVSNNFGTLSFDIGNSGGMNQFLALNYASVTAVPEPSGLLAVGSVLGIYCARRRKLSKFQEAEGR